MTNSDLTKAVLAHVHAALKPLGFRKSGPTFTRNVGDVIQIVNLQKSTSSGGTHIKITVNIGVWVPALAPVRAGVRDKENIWAAQWLMRLGELGPERRDGWWSASNADEANAAGREIAGNIVAFAIPQLEAVSSVERLVELWRAGTSPGLTDVERERYLSKLGGTAA